MPHAEVLLVGPREGKQPLPYEQLMDVLVEYGVHIECDDQDRLPTTLPEDLSGYKVVVVDDDLPALNDPAVKARLDKFKEGGGRIVMHHCPPDLKWHEEFRLFRYMTDILMKACVRTQNPAFLERNARRPDRQVILGQVDSELRDRSWVAYGNDVVFTRAEGLWTAAELYQREDVKQAVVKVFDEILKKVGDNPSPAFCGWNMPVFLVPGNERFLAKCLSQVPSAAEVRRRADLWQKDPPYFRCEEMSQLFVYGQLARLLGKKEYLQPAIDLMKVGHEVLWLKDPELWAHAGIRGKWQGLPWGRGQSWLLFGLVGLLENMPKDHPDYKLLASWVGDTADGLRGAQDPVTGLWQNVVGLKGSRLEMSGSCLIIRHLSRAWRCGALRSPFVPEMLAKAWKGAKAHTFQHRSCTQAYGSDAGYDAMFYALIPQSGVDCLTASGGGDYVKTFGPLVE